MKNIILQRETFRTLVLLLSFILLLSMFAYANEEEDMKKTEELAKNGNLESQQILSMHYLTNGDYKKSFYWNKKIAEQNPANAEFFGVDGEDVVINAQYIVGLCYENGRGVPKDIKKAILWYSKATKQGNKEAAKRYLLILLRLAKEGSIAAQCDLGLMYSKSKDYEKAVYWYGKAAEQDDADAQLNLGCIYLDTKSYDKAVYWFRKAAKQGYAKAQCNLGLCYVTGRGVLKDKDKAAYWFQKAADAGLGAAKKALIRLQK